jgi:hypothetical protein
VSVSDPINTQPIQQFIKIVEQVDKANQKEIKMNLATAKTLANTLGIVMSRLAGDYEELLKNSSSSNSSTSDEVIQVTMDGGTGWK